MRPFFTGACRAIRQTGEVLQLIVAAVCAVCGAFGLSWAISWWWLRPQAARGRRGVPAGDSVSRVGVSERETNRFPRRAAVFSGAAGLGMFTAAWALNQWPSESVALAISVRRWLNGGR